MEVKLIHFGVCLAADSALPVSGVQATIRITEK